LAETDLRARYVAADDIANRERDRDAVERDLGDLVRRLGRDPSSDPETLLLSPEKSGLLNDLLDRRPELEGALNASIEEAEKAHERVRAATEKLEDIGDLADTSRLDIVLETVREAGHDKNIKTLERTCRGAEQAFAAALDRLAPWSGDGDWLARLACPDPDRITRWETVLGRLRQEEADLERERADRADERDRALTEIDLARKNTGGADDEAADRSRALRQSVWRAHREVLSGLGDAPAKTDLDALFQSADRFEARMVDHDAVTSARFRQASDVVRLNRATADLARTDTAIAALARRKDQLEVQRTDVQDEIGAVLQAMALPRDSEPGFLRGWIARRDAALSERAALTRAEGDLRRARDQAEGDRTLLLEAMEAAGLTVEPNQSIGHLIAVARQASERAREVAGKIRTARDLLSDAKSDLSERQRVNKRAADRFEAWSRDWAAALDGTWLADRGGSVAGIREMLSSLGDIAAKLDRRTDLGHRIDAMAADRRAFETAIESLAETVAEPCSEDRVLEVADILDRRLSEARILVARRTEKQGDHRTACNALREAGETAERIAARFRIMRDRFRGDDFADLLQTLDRARQKAELAAQIAGRERDLTETLGVDTVAEADALLADWTGEAMEDDLRVECANADQVCKDLEAHVSTLFFDLKTAETALASVDGDAAVARLEEQRRTLLLEIEDQAVHHLNLSIGALVAENALRAYRDKHRSSMMERAASAFATITAGAFTGLTTVPDKSSEVLVGLRDDGSSMMATGMSKGTRFQLYLALRIAGYAEFAQHRMAFPFFADDIMETFDDDRSAETFQLLAAMPGQVIYLTHHRHLCDIARAVTGEKVTVHDLGRPRAARA